MGVPVLLGLQSVSDPDGTGFLPACRLEIYEAGTLTPRTVFRNPSLSNPHPWPVVMDGTRRFPVMYTGTGNYKARITDAGGYLIAEYDDVQGEVVVTPPTSPPSGTTIPTGAILDMDRIDVVEGWVRRNGRTIGNAASGATERANADCEALYRILWDQNRPDCVVAGGRGATALADFNAGKTITLPSSRGRTRVGLVDMGNSASTLLDAVSFTLGNKTQIGSQLGVASAALTLGQMPLHNHTVTMLGAGAHDHAGSFSDVVAGHTHTELSASNSATAAPGVGVVVAQAFSGNTGTAGAHQHTLAITPVADHVHTISCASVGNSDFVSFVQPSDLVTVYIKL